MTPHHNLINGRLVVADFDETKVKFGNLVGLAPASGFSPGQRAIAYPSFTPDSAYVAFHVSDYATGCDVQGCSDSTKQIGALWIQDIAGAAPVKLDALIVRPRRSLTCRISAMRCGGSTSYIPSSV